MANNLTGDFEAALEVSVRQLNGLIATLHQRGADNAAPTKFIHSTTLRVSAAPIELDVPGAHIGTWLGAVASQFLVPDSKNETLTLAVNKLPPGVAEEISSAFAGWQNPVPVSGAGTTAVRGKAEVQISTPSLSIENGTTSAVTISVFIRAHYYPDQGTLDLPSPINGEVRIIYKVSVVATASGPKLQVTPTENDDEIRFIPKAGTLSSDEADAIQQQIVKAVRGSFRPTEVNLPQGFSFSEFRGLKSGSGSNSQALALPVTLSPDPPAGDIHSLKQLLLGDKDIALAVSREYIDKVFQPLRDSLISQISQTQITETLELGIASPSVTYSLRLTSGPSLAWRNGGMDLSMTIHAKSDTSLAPDANITISQALTFSLNVSSQNVALQSAGNPAVGFTLSSLDDLLPASIRRDAENKIKNSFIAARDQVIPPVSAGISGAFIQSLANIRSGLRSFDDSSSAKFVDLQVTVDGIIVHGTIYTAPRNKPYIHFHETDGGYNALESWIPGGRAIDYNWAASGITHRIIDDALHIHDYTSIMPVSFGADAQGFDRHGFVRSKPYLGVLTFYSQVCLSVTGSQISSKGVPVQDDTTGGFYSIGGTCIPNPPKPLVVLPPGWDDLTIPDWGIPGPVEGPMEVSIIRHFNAASVTPLDISQSLNHVVFFADLSAERPLAALTRALNKASQMPVGFAAVVVLPAGAFKMSRFQFDATMGLKDAVQKPGERIPAVVSLRFAEDYNGTWSRTFDAKGGPTTFLINARGEYVWKQDGEPDADELAAALKKYALPARGMEPGLLNMGLRPGDAMPDIHFQDLNGRYISLRRFLGRPILLNFWQSWSAPSIKELLRLEALYEKGGEDGPLIFAISGDRDPRAVANVQKEHALKFSITHDADRQVIRLFHICCWPTTLSINADGLVDNVQFGPPPMFDPSKINREE